MLVEGGPPEVKFGNVVGRDYMVVRPLRKGSMGSVYVAEQLSTATMRALKVLRRDYLTDETLLKRFEREAHLSARIPSDHVAAVVGSGIDEKIRAPWIAMELLEGQHLGDHVDETGALAKNDVRRIMEEICHALAAAHKLGVVHRDLKPANVFLAETRRTGAPHVVKVLDFGLARVLTDNVTIGGAVMGTPNWMSPEQIRGHAATPATDVWAIGLMAFYMLAGLPFWRACSRPDERKGVLCEIVDDPVPIASTRALELGAGSCLPKGFDPWFAQCVAKSPEDRFLSAAAAYAALAQTLG